MEDNEITIEIVMDIIESYKQTYNKDDISKLTANQWKSVLTFIQVNAGIKPSRKDTEALESLFSIYEYISNIYDQLITISGFCKFCGLNENDLYFIFKGEGASRESIKLVKNIYKTTEESIVDRLTTAKRNPVGLIATLNHRYGWLNEGVQGITTTEERQALDVSDLPKLAD